MGHNSANNYKAEVPTDDDRHARPTSYGQTRGFYASVAHERVQRCSRLPNGLQFLKHAAGNDPQGSRYASCNPRQSKGSSKPALETHSSRCRSQPMIRYPPFSLFRQDPRNRTRCGYSARLSIYSSSRNTPETWRRSDQRWNSSARLYGDLVDRKELRVVRSWRISPMQRLMRWRLARPLTPPSAMKRPTRAGRMK